jgi:hypothetical protein
MKACRATGSLLGQISRLRAEAVSKRRFKSNNKGWFQSYRHLARMKQVSTGEVGLDRPNRFFVTPSFPHWLLLMVTEKSETGKVG